MISPITVTCPGAIAAELHKQKTAEWWSDPVYRAIEASFLRRNPVCYSELKAKYGLSQTCLFKIVHRRTWNHVV